MTDYAAPDDLHLQHLLHAVTLKREHEKHDYKRMIAKTDDVLKDLVALANTPGGEYAGYGYLIIGVDDDGTVLGLHASEQHLSADDRERQLQGAADSKIAPHLAFTVREYTLDGGHRVHLVIVPPNDMAWHMVMGEGSVRGHYVRRGTRSVFASQEDHERQRARLIEQRVQPLRDQLTHLDARLGEYQRALQDVQAERAPQNVGAAQVGRTAFLTPERALARAVRQEAAKFMDAQYAALEELQRSRLDAFVARGIDGLHPEERQDVRRLLERTEAATRPLVEVIGTIIHEVDLTDRVKGSVAEIADVVTRLSFGDLKSSPFIGAVRAYPAHLLLYSAAVAAAAAPDWRAFGIVLHHLHPATSNLAERTARRAAPGVRVELTPSGGRRRAHV